MARSPRSLHRPDRRYGSGERHISLDFSNLRKNATASRENGWAPAQVYAAPATSAPFPRTVSVSSWAVLPTVTLPCKPRTHTLFVFVAMQIIGRRRDACGGQHGDFFGPTASDSSRGRRSLQLMTCHGSGATGGFRCLQQGQLEHLHCGSTPRVLGARRKLLLAGRVLGARRSARRCPGADLFLPGWRGPMSVRGHPSPLCAAR